MKVLIGNGISIYRLLDIQSEKDGSVYISLDRKPRAPNKRLVHKQGESIFTPVAPPTGPRKLSYHTTGRVNYHGLVSSAPHGFFQPLVDITRPNTVLAVSFPSCSLLDKYEGPVNRNLGDCCLPLDHLDRFAIAVTFAPTDFAEQEGIRYSFPDFALLVHPILFDPSPPTSQHFVYAAPPTLFPNQRI